MIKEALWVDGWDGMVIIGHRSSKSTFGANNITRCQNINAKNANIAQSKMQGGIIGYISALPHDFCHFS